MSFHVGVDLLWPKMAVYNESNKETINFKITTKIREESKKEDIEKMFKEIIANINGKLGYACIWCQEYYGNETRKSFVEKGKEIGFLNVQIINENMLIYLDFIKQINHKLKNDTFIWISGSKYLYIWKKINSKAKMVKMFGCGTKFIEIMKKEKNDYGDEINPDIYIYTLYYEHYEHDLNFIKTMFPKCQCLEVEPYWSFSDAALIKARIMANDEEVLDFDVDAQLDEDIDVKINENVVMSIKFYESLPFEKTITIGNNENVFYIFVINEYQEEIQVTPPIGSSKPYKIVVKIDENRIITIEYISHSYMIPKKIITTGNINAVGIDLGTSRCFAAVNRRNGIETIPLDNIGERQLPSYVSFKENEEDCGQYVVSKLQQNANSTIFDSKRIIGRNFIDVKIDANWPFVVVDFDEKPMIQVQCTNGLNFYSSEEIAAVLLKHIKQKAEEIQGKELNEVVITVPATFNEQQKQATHDAAIQAGWNLVHLFPEPIAAAFAYFVDRPIPNEFTILLFDFGGGTLDVCVIKVVNENLNIIATGGDANLGGRDFDNILFNHFSQILEDRYTIKVNSKEKLKYLLLQKCMEIKHNLSVRKEDILDVSDFDTHLEGTVTIATHELETMSTKLLEKTQNVIIGTLSTTEYTSKDIHKVLLVGGSSRMPMIQQLLRKMFTKAEHCCEENPDEVVAIGAAYYAYHIAKNLK